MPDFAYIARDITGRKVEGTLAAGNEREVARAFGQEVLFPLKVDTADGRSGRAAQASPRASRRSWRPRTASLPALLAQRRAAVAVAGSDAQADVAQEPGRSARRRPLRVEEGATLADAMAAHPQAFGELAVSIVRAGGEGGFLEEALDRLAKFTEQQDELKSRVIGALAYPVILVVLGTIVVNVLIIFFVPQVRGAVRAAATSAANCRPSPTGCWAPAACCSYGWILGR